MFNTDFLFLLLYWWLNFSLEYEKEKKKIPPPEFFVQASPPKQEILLERVKKV